MGPHFHWPTVSTAEKNEHAAGGDAISGVVANDEIGNAISVYVPQWRQAPAERKRIILSGNLR